MIRFFDNETSDISFNTSTRKSLGYNLSIGTIESMELESNPNFYQWSRQAFLSNEEGSSDFDVPGREILAADQDFCMRYGKSKFIFETVIIHFVERNWIIVAPYKVMSSWLTWRLDFLNGESFNRITSFNDDVWAQADKIIWFVREPADKIVSGLKFISKYPSGSYKDLRRWAPNVIRLNIETQFEANQPPSLDERHISDHLGDPHIMPLFYWLPFDHSLTNIEVDLCKPTWVSPSDHLYPPYGPLHPFKWGNQKYRVWEDIFENVEMNFDPIHEYVSMDNVVSWALENFPDLVKSSKGPAASKLINSTDTLPTGFTYRSDFDVNKIRDQIPNQVRLYESLRKNCSWVS